MSNSLYDLGREAFLGGDIDWDANNIKAMLIDEGVVTINLTTDQYHSDHSGAGVIATSGNFASKTKTNGVADAADLTLTSVSGATVESIDIYQDTGTSATSRLICNIDTATGLPLTPDGGNVTVTWDNGSNKIFKL
jgi:hypothetical protein